jgi:transcription elongation factor Elf1
MQYHVRFKTYRELLIGFTNPNAHSPVCGNPVFFYASPFGGRVFFDELGPPWPKHPCTDRGRPVQLIHPSNTSNHIHREFFVDGWQPFLCQDIQTVKTDQSVFKLTGLLGDAKETFFAIKVGLSEGVPFLIKSEDNKLLMSTIIYNRGEIKADTFRIFRFESEVHNLMDSSNNSRQLSGINRRPRKLKPTTPNTLSAPTQESKSSPKLEQCPECGAMVRKLDTHIRRVHIDQRLASCDICNTKVRNLSKHLMNTHSPQAISRLEKQKVKNELRRLEQKMKKDIARKISSITKRGFCPMCNFKSKSEIVMLAHFRSIHKLDSTDIARFK